MGASTGYEWAVPMLGWFFLPKIAASVIQRLWYSVTKRGLKSKPPPLKNSLEHRQNYTWILAGVIVAYLSYTVLQFERNLGSNHYDSLGLQFGTFTQKQLKTNFRKASLQHHPDKIGEAGAEIFVKIRAAHELLVDPVTRIAYDRFGPGISGCTTCKMTKDFIAYGMNDFKAFYIGSMGTLFLLGLVGKAGYGRYWRYVALAFMASWELGMLLGPKQSSLVSHIFPRRTTYEQLRIARQVFVAVFVAINQIGPHIVPSEENRVINIKDAIKQAVEQNETLDERLMDHLKDSFDVFREDAECMTQLKRQLNNIIFESFLAALQPSFQDARMGVYKRVKNPLVQAYREKW